MTELFKEEFNIEEFAKEEVVSIQEEILPSSTVEDTSTVNINKDDIKMENTEIQGKLHVCQNYSLKSKYILISTLSCYFKGGSDFTVKFCLKQIIT